MFNVKWPSIQYVTPGESEESPTEIVRDSEWTIVGVNTNISQSYTWLVLPSGCDVGDLVEIQGASSAVSSRVLAPTGESFAGGGGNGAVPGFYRKMTSQMWSPGS